MVHKLTDSRHRKYLDMSVCEVQYADIALHQSATVTQPKQHNSKIYNDTSDMSTAKPAARPTAASCLLAQN